MDGGLFSSGLFDFALKLAMGSAMIALNLGIQVWAVNRIIIYFQGFNPERSWPLARQRNIRVLTIVLGFLFLGHLLQFSTWAVLFVVVGEFQDFGTAFYHSTVNFTSLGYGDIVMSPRWRLLGALEAANGVLMFGLTAGLVLSVMSKLLVAESESLGRAESPVKLQNDQDRDH